MSSLSISCAASLRSYRPVGPTATLADNLASPSRAYAAAAALLCRSPACFRVAVVWLWLWLWLWCGCGCGAAVSERAVLHGCQAGTARRRRCPAVTSPVWPGSAAASASPPAGRDAASLHRPPPPFSCAASVTPGRPETNSPSVHVSTTGVLRAPVREEKDTSLGQPHLARPGVVTHSYASLE